MSEIEHPLSDAEKNGQAIFQKAIKQYQGALGLLLRPNPEGVTASDSDTEGAPSNGPVKPTEKSTDAVFPGADPSGTPPGFFRLWTANSVKPTGKAQTDTGIPSTGLFNGKAPLPQGFTPVQNHEPTTPGCETLDVEDFESLPPRKIVTLETPSQGGRPTTDQNTSTAERKYRTISAAVQRRQSGGSGLIP